MAEAQIQQQADLIEKLLINAVEKGFDHNDAIVGQTKRYVESLKFDHFDENITHEAMGEIEQEHFECVVNSIASRHGIPDEVCKEIVASQNTDEYLARFYCQPDGMTNFHYGVIVTRLNNGKIDLAYFVYNLAFGLLPDLVRKTNKEDLKLFGFTLASRYSTEYVPKTKVLSHSDQKLLNIYCHTKAIESFRRALK